MGFAECFVLLIYKGDTIVTSALPSRAIYYQLYPSYMLHVFFTVSIFFTGGLQTRLGGFTIKKQRDAAFFASSLCEIREKY